MTVYRPADYGAVGDGVADDLPALDAMVADLPTDEPAVIDLSGRWYVSTTWRLTAPQRSRVQAGAIEALPGADMDTLLELVLGTGTRVRDPLEVAGARTDHLASRTVDTLVRVISAWRCQVDGIEGGWCRRDGLLVDGHAIGARIGSVRLDRCGSAGWPTAVPHTRATSTTTQIVREGSAASPVQRARVYCPWSTDLPDLQPGDHVQIGGRPWPDGGDLVEVVDLEADAEGEYLRVYPWPGRHHGAVALEVESRQGALVRVAGANTAGMQIGGIEGGYCGAGLALASLYGVSVGTLLIEVAGAGVVYGAGSSQHRGSVIGTYHPEVCVEDVVQAGLSVLDCRILTASAYRPWLWRKIAPRYDSGVPTALGWGLGVTYG